MTEGTGRSHKLCVGCHAGEASFPSLTKYASTALPRAIHAIYEGDLGFPRGFGKPIMHAQPAWLLDQGVSYKPCWPKINETDRSQRASNGNQGETSEDENRRQVS